MRIAFDHQIFYLQSYGGISRYYTRLAEELFLKGEDVGIFAPLNRNHYIRHCLPSIVHGISLESYPSKAMRLIQLSNRLLAKRAIKSWQPQVVHETYYASSGSAPKNCATVVTVYDMIHELFAEQFPTFDEITAWKRKAIKRANHVICISETTRRDLLNLFDICEEKVSTVHLGFDSFTYEPELINCKIYSDQKPYLLYVGNRTGYKNFSGLLYALASSKNLVTDFNLIAFGGGKFSPQEINLVSTLGFQSGQVRHMEGDDQILGCLYEQAAAFVYPSLYEGFGLPPLEAMAHHCPVISSNTSSMPEVIGDAGEFFDPNSTENIAKAIENVVYSPSRIKDLVKRGHQRLNIFTWGKCAEKTLELYHSLAK